MKFPIVGGVCSFSFSKVRNFPSDFCCVLFAGKLDLVHPQIPAVSPQTLIRPRSPSLGWFLIITLEMPSRWTDYCLHGTRILVIDDFISIKMFLFDFFDEQSLRDAILKTQRNVKFMVDQETPDGNSSNLIVRLCNFFRES